MLPDIRNNSGYSLVVFSKYLTAWDAFVHELGHTFSLRHPVNTSGFTEGNSTNFMDYGRIKNMFWKWQWEIINTNNDFK
jgi:hypothetical protein